MPSRDYNLFDEPWIPVRWVPSAPHSTSGTPPDLVGVRELLLRSGELWLKQGVTLQERLRLRGQVPLAQELSGEARLTARHHACSA